MPILTEKPKLIEAAGNKPKLIKEYFGRINSNDEDVSIAIMRSPGGWVEPGQTPEFDEYTIVLQGRLMVSTKHGQMEILAGQAVRTCRGEWVQYSTPDPNGAEYIAICLPAFSPTLVNRDEQYNT